MHILQWMPWLLLTSPLRTINNRFLWSFLHYFHLSVHLFTYIPIPKQTINMVTGHLSEGSFVWNVVVQIPKYDAKPNPNSNPNSNRSPNPMPIRFGQMTLRTSKLLPINISRCTDTLVPNEKIRICTVYLKSAPYHACIVCAYDV